MNTDIEEFTRTIGEGIEKADFKTQRSIIELLDVRGKLAIENNEKVVYISCKLGQQNRSPIPTSPLSNNHNRTPVRLTAKLVF